MREAREAAGPLSACLLALRSGEDGVDAQAAAFVLAETLLMWRATVTKKK